MTENDTTKASQMKTKDKVTRRLKGLRANRRAYALWRLDKNISWHNIHTYFMGIIYGLFALEWLLPKKSYWKRIFPVWKFWMPPVWDDGDV